MKKLLIAGVLLTVLRTSAFAGFLSGSSMPYVEKTGSYAFKLRSSIAMFYSPFSSIELGGKYAYSDELSFYAKYGVGTIDYTAIAGLKLTSDPQISTFGFEYVMSGARGGEYTAFVMEYESASWSINRVSNISNEIQLAMDFGMPSSGPFKTRYRLSLNNFNAGTESNEKIATSLKYGMATEVEYRMNANMTASFDGGIYFGDTNGLIAYFGAGLGYNP